MKNKILIAIAANLIMVTTMLPETANENTVKVNVPDKSTYTYLFEQLPQPIQNHPKTTLASLAQLFVGAHLLSQGNLLYNHGNIYSDIGKNALLGAVTMMLTGLGGLLYCVFNAPATEKSDNFIETTN